MNTAGVKTVTTFSMVTKIDLLCSNLFQSNTTSLQVDLPIQYAQ